MTLLIPPKTLDVGREAGAAGDVCFEPSLLRRGRALPKRFDGVHELLLVGAREGGDEAALPSSETCGGDVRPAPGRLSASISSRRIAIRRRSPAVSRPSGRETTVTAAVTSPEGTARSRAAPADSAPSGNSTAGSPVSSTLPACEASPRPTRSARRATSHFERRPVIRSTMSSSPTGRRRSCRGRYPDPARLRARRSRPGARERGRADGRSRRVGPRRLPPSRRPSAAPPLLDAAARVRLGILHELGDDRRAAVERSGSGSR